MIIGIPKETTLEEKRVALAPAGVDTLIRDGHSVYIETKAGIECNFSDEEYTEVGATIVYSAEEVYQRSDILAKIAPLTEQEAGYLREEQILFSFLHLAAGSKKVIDHLLKKRVTAVSYELIEKHEELPVLQSMSEIAGQLAIQMGERFLGSDIKDSRGILMGGITGVAPAAVVILGAGVVGLNAARAALGRGAQVIMLDKDIYRLRRVENYLEKRVTTVVANPYTIARGAKFADLFIGAVQVRGEKSPHVVTEAMVKTMKKGAVIVDVSIDQGGCIETSRPTSLSEPFFVKHNTIHCCVPNLPSYVARTASYGLTNASINYISDIANNGLSSTVLGDSEFAKGIVAHNGTCTNEVIAETFDLEYRRLHIFSTN